MKLVLKNNVGKIESEYQVTDLNDSIMYFHFENFVLQENLPSGEYDYSLYDDDNVLVAQGIAQIGDYNPESTKTYEKNKQTYKQYNG